MEPFVRSLLASTTLGVLTLTPLLSARPGEARDPKLDLDFGRFSEKLVRCSVSAPGEQRSLRSCGQLRLEQNVEGVMSVRFSLSANSNRYGREELVFAGILANDSEPMDCGDDGRCQPRFPLVFSVNAIASGLYNRRGLAATLPRARIARGQCRIEAVRASCEASGQDGARWRAEGFFLSHPPPDVQAAQR